MDDLGEVNNVGWGDIVGGGYHMVRGAMVYGIGGMSKLTGKLANWVADGTWGTEDYPKPWLPEAVAIGAGCYSLYKGVRLLCCKPKRESKSNENMGEDRERKNGLEDQKDMLKGIACTAFGVSVFVGTFFSLTSSNE